MENNKERNMELENSNNSANSKNSGSDNVWMPLSNDWNKERLETLKKMFPDLFTNEGKLNINELKKVVDPASVSETERYEFRWFGKSAAKRNAFSPSNATLIFDEKRSVNPSETENLIIEGENLEVLKLLSTAYREKVKCIYIDPPYNTGKDFVYSDNYSQDKKAYWEDAGVTEEGLKIDTNTETDGRYHSNWLNMMYSRLLIARQLLTEDGVVMISIDDNEVHHLRKLCEEIFGEENFIASLIWEKGRKNDSRFFSIGHEYIMIYAMDRNYLQEKDTYWREEKPGAREIYDEYVRLKKIHGQDFAAMENGIKTFYSSLSKNHPSKKLQRYSNIDKWGIWRDDNMSLPREGHIYDLLHPNGKVCAMPPDGWRFDHETMLMKIEDGYVEFRNDHTQPPFRKTYLVREDINEPMSEEDNNDNGYEDEEETEEIGIQVAGTYFYRSGLQATNELQRLFKKKKLFNNPKDHQVLERLIRYCTQDDKECLVMDFFGGSGTTLHSILELNKSDNGNRKCILVQIPEILEAKTAACKAGYKKISDITIERNKRVVEKIIEEKKKEQPDLFTNVHKEDVIKGLGFKVFKLVKSNFPRVEFAPDPEKTTEENIELLKKYIRDKEAQLITAFNRDELVTEILIKNGFTLNYALTKQDEFKKNEIFFATDGEKETLICLDVLIDMETVEYFKKHTHQKFICLERALDTTKKWNLKHYLGEKFKAF
jgi:adenine-specific DNA-methyltransferase